MGMREKIQYRVRTLMYEWEQKRRGTSAYKHSEGSFLNEFLEGLDGVEGYLEQQIAKYKDKTNRPY